MDEKKGEDRPPIFRSRPIFLFIILMQRILRLIHHCPSLSSAIHPEQALHISVSSLTRKRSKIATLPH